MKNLDPYPPLESRGVVSLHVTFCVGNLSPRGVRRRFVDSLRIAIARARTAGEIDPDISEELWRSLVKSELA